MVRLLPQIQRFLVFLPTLRDEHVNRFRVGYMSVSFETKADLMSVVGGRDI